VQGQLAPGDTRHGVLQGGTCTALLGRTFQPRDHSGALHRLAVHHQRRQVPDPAWRQAARARRHPSQYVAVGRQFHPAGQLDAQIGLIRGDDLDKGALLRLLFRHRCRGFFPGAVRANVCSGRRMSMRFCAELAAARARCFGSAS
jgi:hypothetical protein